MTSGEPQVNFKKLPKNGQLRQFVPEESTLQVL